MSDHHKLMSINEKHQHTHNCKEDDEENDQYQSVLRPMIFDAQNLNEVVPSGFNAVRIPLNAALHADLLWKKERQAAENYVKIGLHIFWDIELGLTDGLPLPLSNQSQFLSLSLALEHFRDTLLKDFGNESIGICLHRGSADLSTKFVWDETQLNNLREWLKETYKDTASFSFEMLNESTTFTEVSQVNLSSTPQGKRILSLYCRDVIIDYVQQLSDKLPESLPCYFLVDTQSISDPFLQMQLTSKEYFAKIHFGVRGTLFNDHILTWENPHQKGQLGFIARNFNHFEGSPIKVGVCIPSSVQYHPSKWIDFEEILDMLTEKNIPLRVFTETSMTAEWDGLDFIITSPKHLITQSSRKLQGFCAAGGTVIFTDEVKNCIEEFC